MAEELSNLELAEQFLAAPPTGRINDWPQLRPAIAALVDEVKQSRANPAPEWLPGGAQGGEMPADANLICSFANCSSEYLGAFIDSEFWSAGVRTNLKWSDVPWYIPCSSIAPPAI